MNNDSFLTQYLSRSFTVDEYSIELPESVAHAVWDGLPKLAEATRALRVALQGRSIEVPDDLMVQLLLVMAELSGQSLSCSHLAHRMGMPPKEVLKMLAAAELAGLWRHVRSFDSEDVEIEDKSKGYLADAGLMAELLGVTSPIELDTHRSWGAIFETFIVNRVAAALPAKAKLHFWRTAHGFAEVDVVIVYDSCLYPIEIKSAVHASLSNAKKIAVFKECYAPHYKIAPGLIVYAGNRYYRLGDEVFAVPFALL